MSSILNSSNGLVEPGSTATIGAVGMKTQPPRSATAINECATTRCRVPARVVISVLPGRAAHSPREPHPAAARVSTAASSRLAIVSTAPSFRTIFRLDWRTTTLADAECGRLTQINAMRHCAKAKGAARRPCILKNSAFFLRRRRRLHLLRLGIVLRGCLHRQAHAPFLVGLEHLDAHDLSFLEVV